MLKERRETLELQTEITATKAKINYLREAEMGWINPVKSHAALISDQKPVLGAKAEKASASTATAAQLDEKLANSLYFHDKSATVVRNKTQFQFPNFYLAENHQAQYVVQPEANSNVQQQPQPTSVHSIPSAIPLAQNTQEIAQENHIQKY